MKKELGTIQALFPMPVLVIAAYYAMGEKVGQAWNAGAALAKAALGSRK